MKYLLLLVAVMMLGGCSGARSAIVGGIYTSAKSPVAATSNKSASKKGTACATSIIGFATGDASLEAAKADGGITSVSSVDSEATSVLGLYAKFCTVVRGS